jgi:D-serine deaminase-like pyridoxal phosphate-dependent protein
MWRGRQGRPFPHAARGDEVRLIPGHCDLTANLYD